MEHVKGSTKNDLPTTGAPEMGKANGIILAHEPVDFLELKASLLSRGKIKHAGGALPPLFPEKGLREGDAKLVSFIGFEVVPEERSGGSGGSFVVLNFEVHDHTKENLPIAYRAQMIQNAVMETYFGGTKVKDLDEKNPVVVAAGGLKKIAELASDDNLVIPTRDPEKTPILMITYAGQNAAKKQGFSGTKRWIIEEFFPAKRN